MNNAPPPPPKIDITGVSANPNSVQVGQQMNFVANLSSAQGVTKVDLIFPDAGDLTEPMIQSGATKWSKTRTMQAAAANRQFKVRATLANGTAIIQAGTFAVTAPPVAPPPPSQPAVSITGISANPNSVQVGQQMNFVANLNTAQGVSKVDLIFPDAGDLTEPMIQSGATKWSKTRTMQAAAANRQFKVRATLANGTAIIQAGTFAVTAPPVAPPPPSQPAVSITGISANPNSVQVGQQMNFVANLNTAQGVSKIELVFPEVGVVEPMQQTGATQWSRINRPMSQAGANRPYQIVVTTSTGQTVQSAIGSYTVNNAPPPSQPPASTSPVQPPPSSLPQLSIGNISVSTSGNPDVSFSTNRPIVSTDVSVDGKDRNLINYSCTTGTQVSCKINRWPISRGNFGISIQVRDANGMSANAKAGFSR